MKKIKRSFFSFLIVAIFLLTTMNSVAFAYDKTYTASAVIDGCGIYGVIFRIILPVTKPAIVTVTVMTFLNVWNEFILANTYLNTTTFRTLPFSVFEFASRFVSQYSIQFAVMVITAIPAIIIYIALNEHITKGVTMGAVKG